MAIAIDDARGDAAIRQSLRSSVIAAGWTP